MSEENRAEAMAHRVERACLRARFDAAGVALVVTAYRLAIARRTLAFPDPQHPEFLHPGRTALILLEDLGARDPVLPAAAAVCDTLRPELGLPLEQVEAALGPEARRLAQAVPAPASAGDRLAELLVSADGPVRLIALSERLDHARHLHLGESAGWHGWHRETCELYLPVAERTHPTLARRYRWWCRMFRRRFLDAQPVTGS
ncbi:MAG: hypothetical protein HY561_09620 [Gemmatimonadetes bacterium]|nr:hypothetical protein [Gemmatimonadota bacterium]